MIISINGTTSIVQNIILCIMLFAITRIYSMDNVCTNVLHNHNIIALQGAHLIQANINSATAEKWRSLLDQASEFQKNNPDFPYRLLARSPGYGPDAQGIANAAPVVIAFLEKEYITLEHLNKFRFSLGTPYIARLMKYRKKRTRS